MGALASKDGQTALEEIGSTAVMKKHSKVADTAEDQTLYPSDISLDLNGLYGYQNVVVHTSQVVGAGSYGSVVKATLDQVPCAAKILHKIFLDSQDPGLTKFITSFEQECQILRDLKHHSIVQFLGVVQDPNTKKPILLMELMKESLTGFLESSPTNIPYHLQVNISHDIALAVAHLHRNGIVHRDLSSNNILLNENHKAKVTDFGMSKISSSDPSMTRSRVTQCPGTLVYMPPEALRPKPRYSDKIDSFSIGVLLVQIVTRNFPAPTEASITRDDPNSPTGESYIPVSEIERRRSDIVKISASHGFLSIINNCLKDTSQDRPTAAQLCQNLGELKNTQTYSDSVKVHIIMKTPFEVVSHGVGVQLQNKHHHYSHDVSDSATLHNTMRKDIKSDPVTSQVQSTGGDTLQVISDESHEVKYKTTTSTRSRSSTMQSTRSIVQSTGGDTLQVISDDESHEVKSKMTTTTVSTSRSTPVIKGADIIAQTIVDVDKDGGKFHYTWGKNGIEIDIPAGTINCGSKPVTMSIQASYTDYKFPNDYVPVSAVYWLALNPPVKKFVKKVTVRIQHCADVDSEPYFVTANCTQETLPYNFMPLSGGKFTYTDCDSIKSYGYGSIEVEHFSALTILGKDEIFYAFCSYYLPGKALNYHEIHITVTPDLEQHIEAVKSKYIERNGEEGQSIVAKIRKNEISLHQTDVDIIPEAPWIKDSWELSPLIKPPTLFKERLEHYKPGRVIPYISIGLRLIDCTNAQPLTETVTFTGIKPKQSIEISRIPQQAALAAAMISSSENCTTTRTFLSYQDLFEVMDELVLVTARWRRIGMALRIDPAKLDVIEGENTELDTRLSKTITLWLNKTYDTEEYGNPSWNFLADAVAHPAGGNNPSLAIQIRAKVCK